MSLRFNGDGAACAGHFVAMCPVLHVPHGAPGLEQFGQGLAQLDVKLRGVEGEQELIAVDALALGDGESLDEAIERGGEGLSGRGLDASDQAESIFQGLALYLQPAGAGRGGGRAALVGDEGETAGQRQGQQK